MNLFPSGPNLRAKANCSLLAVSDDGCFHQRGIFKEFILLGELIVHILHIGNFLGFVIPIDQLIHTAHGPQNAIKLLACHTELDQIDALESNAAFFEPALCFFRIKAFAFTENLNIQ